MRLLEGRDLQTFVQRRLDPGRAVRIIEQVAKAARRPQGRVGPALVEIIDRGNGAGCGPTVWSALGERQQASRGALPDIAMLIEGLVGGGDESAAWVRLRHANVGDFQLDVELVARTGRGGPGEVN